MSAKRGVFVQRKPRLLQILVWLLCLAQVWLGTPALTLAAGNRPTRQTPRATEVSTPPVKANRTVPKVTPPPTVLALPSRPTDQDLERARIFSEPLVPMPRPTSPDEDAALGRAIMAYAGTHRSEMVAPLIAFLVRYPESAWGPSLQANLGTVYRANGYLSRALAEWKDAWDEAKTETEPQAKAVADFALGQYLHLSSQVGHSKEVATALKEIAGRRITGSAGQQVAMAREASWVWTYHHGEAQASGSAALESILAYRAYTQHEKYTPNAALRDYLATPAGTSLLDLKNLAGEAGLSWKMALRSKDGPIPVPSVMHWRVDHYSAIVQRKGDRYLLIDPIFGGSRWVSRAALDEEGSGYFLAPASALGPQMHVVSETEAKAVIGNCAPGAPDDDDPGPPNQAGPSPNDGSGNPPGPSPGNSSPCGMPGYSFLMMPASLRIADTPVSCHSPVGPVSAFHVTYNQRDGNAPQIFSYGNLGPKWTFDWLSWVMDDPTALDDHADVYLRGGGTEHYTNAVNGAYPAHWRSRAVLVRVSNDPIRYERRLPDGSVEVFSQSDGVITSGRRVFLTEVIDPQGLTLQLTYDASLRLVAVTNAIGLVTTLSYDLPSDPLKITKVTDPYGRYAALTYNADGELASITDVIGMTSSFGYGPDDFITRLTTPYGSTVFSHETDPTQTNYFRFLQATDPLGGTERVEFHWSTTAVAASEPSGVVPTGFANYNNSLDHYDSFYWNKRAMALYPLDPSKATITHWLMYVFQQSLPVPYSHAFSTSVPHSIKRPLENRVWYGYADEDTNGTTVGSWIAPTTVGRVLDDGSSQIWQATYNDEGQVTSRTDPLGRQTSETYDTNGIDLLTVRQTTSGLNDLLASFSNYTAGHLPQTVTDAAGETTAYTYNSFGEVLTRRNAKNETTTYAYDTNGYLQSITGPDPSATVAYTYDSYGRVRTETGPDGYVLTFDYDALDRPTQVTYPDGTTDSVTYDKLDIAQQQDRLSRITRFYHDALGRLTAVRDPLGRMTTQQWCTCGTLDKLVDAKGQATSWQYDVENRVTQEVRADDTTTTTYAYETTTSRLASVTDPKGQVKSYTYDLDDRLAAIAYSNTDQPTATVSFAYDPAYPRLLSMTDGTGTTSYAYQAVGTLGATELASVDGPLDNDTIIYGYDELGRVTSRAVNGVSVSWNYDNLGRLTSEVNPLGTFIYGYDGATARLASASYPDGQTSAYTYFNNVGDRRLQTILHDTPTGTTLSRFDYTYNAVGDILTWQQQADTAPADTWTYGYDRADQLTTAV
ncbi:MAG: peptidase C39, bacteriocin processing, partial [Acidobacteriota bacterium]|nr:peptidase C39, bacteriocin processing [Acidobacteriota bacterium]